MKVHPRAGESSEKVVSVEDSGASVAAVLQAAGRDPNNMKVTMNGKEVSLDAHVPPDAVLTLTERPQGS
ncbi:MAG: hypothetical protein KC877_04920 [Candidatus Kaiserbacteria bacterium]|nr:hypothetical protein [Candidatus Kaiserbacteria bacterium]